MWLGGKLERYEGQCRDESNVPESRIYHHTRRNRLMRKMMVLSSVVLSVLMIGTYGFADEGGKPGIQATRMKVNGVISKVESGLTTVKTS